MSIAIHISSQALTGDSSRYIVADTIVTGYQMGHFATYAMICDYIVYDESCGIHVQYFLINYVTTMTSIVLVPFLRCSCIRRAHLADI